LLAAAVAVELNLKPRPLERATTVAAESAGPGRLVGLARLARRQHRQRGAGVAESARAYDRTVITAAFSASSRGSTLSKVSAAVWW